MTRTVRPECWYPCLTQLEPTTCLQQILSDFPPRTQGDVSCTHLLGFTGHWVQDQVKERKPHENQNSEGVSASREGRLCSHAGMQGFMGNSHSNRTQPVTGWAVSRVSGGHLAPPPPPARPQDSWNSGAGGRAWMHSRCPCPLRMENPGASPRLRAPLPTVLLCLQGLTLPSLTWG